MDHPISSTQENPVDYLDKISTTPAKKMPPKNMLFIIVIIIGVLVTLIVSLTVIFGSSKNKDIQLITLNAHTSSLKGIVDSSQKQLTSSSLRATNSSLQLILINLSRDVKAELAKNKIDLSKNPPKITLIIKPDKLNLSLKNAQLNGIFNRTYASEMEYQLEALLSQISKTKHESKNKDFIDMLDNASTQIKLVQKQLAGYNDLN